MPPGMESEVNGVKDAGVVEEPDAAGAAEGRGMVDPPGVVDVIGMICCSVAEEQSATVLCNKTYVKGFSYPVCISV